MAEPELEPQDPNSWVRSHLQICRIPFSTIKKTDLNNKFSKWRKPVAFWLRRAGHVPLHLFQPPWGQHLFLPFSPAEKTPDQLPLWRPAQEGRVLCTSGPVCPFQGLARDKSVLFCSLCHPSHSSEAWLIFTAPSVYPLSLTSP